MITPLKRTVVLFCFTIMVLVAASGCRNTAHGIGKDVENAGEKIQEKTR